MAVLVSILTHMGTLAERKVFRLGRSLVFIIPKGWVNWAGLKAGDWVQVETNGKLVIRPLKKRGREKSSAT